MKFNLLASASTFAIGGFAALALPDPAQAGLTCSVSSCSETVTATPEKTDFTGETISVDDFHPGAGQTLTSVVLSDNANFSAVGSLKNTSNSTQSFTFNAGLALNLTGGTGAPSGFPFIYAQGAINPQTYTLTAGSSTPYNFSNSFTSNSQTLSASSSDLSGFIGSSTFQAVFSANATTTFNGGGNNVQTNLTTTATPNVTITYNYAQGSVTPPPAVPEPASIAALGAGLAGLGVMRRRRVRG